MFDMRNRISELRAQRGWSQADLGDAIGAHWQTISRLENSDERLRPKRERQIAEAFGIAVEDIYPVAGMRLVKVTQHVEAGLYSESFAWPEDQTYEVAVPDDPALKGVKLYAAEARGPSMANLYPEGTILVYRDCMETGENLEPGKRYIVEREMPDGLRESTVKTLRLDDDGQLWLVPETSDPRFAAVPLEAEDGVIVRIVGRVVYSVRRE